MAALGRVKAGVAHYTALGERRRLVPLRRSNAPAAADSSADSVAVAAALLAGPVVSDPVASRDNWFRNQRTNSFIASVLFLIILLASIAYAKSGKPIFIRRIAGLNAIDEAIGRATEIGKKVLYIPGIQSMDEIQTVASIAILGSVARTTARYGTDLDVPNKDPLTFASAREVVRAAYLAEGGPTSSAGDGELRHLRSVRIHGRGVRPHDAREAGGDLPGRILLRGIAHPGGNGAIDRRDQIAGQADPTSSRSSSRPATTLIGEELYAAARISRAGRYPRLDPGAGHRQGDPDPDRSSCRARRYRRGPLAALRTQASVSVRSFSSCSSRSSRSSASSWG
jgi:hypothetical protein